MERTRSGFFGQILLMCIHIYLSLFLLLPACNLQTQDSGQHNSFPVNKETPFRTIGQIPPPDGFAALPIAKNSFGEWLRTVCLKKDNRIFLYNGSLKPDQTAQFAVLDMPLGNKDLQQCADAVMRLRAAYFFSRHAYDSILFKATDGTVMSFAKWEKGTRYRLSGNKLKAISSNNTVNLQSDFEDYLETVFSYAGTCSLAGELVAVKEIQDLQPGDVFIKPGFPGHAMIVMDVVMNKKGVKRFMLAQGYMPAQDIHIVRNYMSDEMSPWYEIPGSGRLITPGWTFNIDQLKRWR